MLIEAYGQAFGYEAAEAFEKAIRAWHAGIEVIAEKSQASGSHREVRTEAKTPARPRRPSTALPVAQTLAKCDFSADRSSLRSVVTRLVAASWGLTGQLASARQVFTLRDNNSSIVVNTSTRPAISSWIVGGVPHLELSNWFRISRNRRRKHPAEVGPLALQSSMQTGANSARVVYTHPQFLLQLDYGVTGGAPGSGFSSMGEEVRITNTTAAPPEFHFFEYVDLDLTNTPGDDSGSRGSRRLTPRVFGCEITAGPHDLGKGATNP